MTQNYKFADIVFKVTTTYSLTQKLAKDYLTNEKEEVVFNVSQEDIDAERLIEKENEPLLNSPDYYLEFIALQRKITNYLISRDVYLIHGVLLSKDNKGYIFLATSGTGKSTHVFNWQKVFGSRVEIINGDKPFVKIENGKAYAYGTPWCGKELIQKNKKVELNNVVILNRGKENQIKPVSLTEAFPILYQQVYKPNVKEATGKTLNFLTSLAKITSLYNLECNMDKSSASVAYSGMNKTLTFEDVLDMDGSLSYLTKGVSMWPFIIQDHDISTIKKLDRELKVDDVILYKRPNGSYVLHRLIKIKGDKLYCLGDNLYHIERDIKKSQVLGYLVSVDKGNGKVIYTGSKEENEYLKRLKKKQFRRRIRLFFVTKVSSLKRRLKKLFKKDHD